MKYRKGLVAGVDEKIHDEEHASKQIPEPTQMTLTTEVDRYDNPQQLTPEQKYNMSESQFIKEILVLKNRITRLEDMAIQQQKETTVVSRFELAPTNGPTEPPEEIPTITTPSQEFKRLKRFLLPPPRQDPMRGIGSSKSWVQQAAAVPQGTGG